MVQDIMIWGTMGRDISLGHDGLRHYGPGHYGLGHYGLGHYKYNFVVLE